MLPLPRHNETHTHNTQHAVPHCKGLKHRGTTPVPLRENDAGWCDTGSGGLPQQVLQLRAGRDRLHRVQQPQDTSRHSTQDGHPHPKRHRLQLLVLIKVREHEAVGGQTDGAAIIRVEAAQLVDGAARACMGHEAKQGTGGCDTRAATQTGELGRDEGVGILSRGGCTLLCLSTLVQECLRIRRACGAPPTTTMFENSGNLCTTSRTHTDRAAYRHTPWTLTKYTAMGTAQPYISTST